MGKDAEELIEVGTKSSIELPGNIPTACFFANTNFIVTPGIALPFMHPKDLGAAPFVAATITGATSALFIKNVGAATIKTTAMNAVAMMFWAHFTHFFLTFLKSRLKPLVSQSFGI